MQTTNQRSNLASTVAERRRDRRIAVDDVGIAKLITPIDREPRPVRIVDISRAGVKLISDREIPAGVILQVRMGDMLILGAVRHCTQLDGGFQIGILVEQLLRRRRSSPIPGLDDALLY